MPSRTKKFRGLRTHGRGKKSGRGAGDGKRGQTDRIGQIVEEREDAAAFSRQAHEGEHGARCRGHSKRQQQPDGIGERARRHRPDKDIADHAAADGGERGQNGNAEDVHPPRQRDERA